MKCPACGNELKAVVVNDITVDVCENGCGGIWFDRFELKKVDEAHESAGEKLLIIDRNPNVDVNYTARRNCPKCDDIVMMQHFFSVKKEVAVDECPNCAGFWLDFGELGKIRGQFNSEEERSKAAEAYFAEVFDGKLAKMKSESHEQLEKAKKIANIFRFICPSNYISGKQDWGAF